MLLITLTEIDIHLIQPNISLAQYYIKIFDCMIIKACIWVTLPFHIWVMNYVHSVLDTIIQMKRNLTT